MMMMIMMIMIMIGKRKMYSMLVTTLLFLFFELVVLFHEPYGREILGETKDLGEIGVKMLNIIST